MGTVGLIYVTGHHLLAPRTGLFAALLLAVAPYHVWYAQEARPYAGLAFFSLLSLYCFALLLRRPTRGAWLGFTLASILNVYNHLFGLLPLATEVFVAGGWTVAAWLLFRIAPTDHRRRACADLRRSATAVAGGVVTTLVASLPLQAGMTKWISERAPNGTDDVVPPVELTGHFLVRLFGAFGAGYGWAFWLLVTLCGVGVGAGLFRRQWFVVAALAWFSLPLGVLWLSQPRTALVPRHLLFMQPVYLLLVAHGLTHLSFVLARLLRPVAVAVAGGGTPAPRRESIVSGLAGGLLIGGLMALTLPLTWESYRVEKRNDWSAICAYLRGRVEPGDHVVGTLYTEGIMSWCFAGEPDVSLARADEATIAAAAASGRNVWYIFVGRGVPEAVFAREHYVMIPRNAWARPGLLSQAQDRETSRLVFGQFESPATLYHYQTTPSPARVTLRDRRGSGSVPDHAEIAPGAAYPVRLSLPATAPRVLRLVCYDSSARDLQVVVDDVPLATVFAGRSSGQWVPIDVPLPAQTGDSFVLKLWNPGTLVSAVSEVEVRYADTGR